MADLPAPIALREEDSPTKTETTVAIEKALRKYCPTTMGGITVNKFRGRHKAYEVPVECGTTAGGLIDCVEVCEYFGSVEPPAACAWPVWKKAAVRNGYREPECARGFPAGEKPRLCDERGCRWNIKARTGISNVLIICFEIKVTKADFKSVNGHNFIGNLNYYVVPVSLYPDIRSMVPDDIGIIAYYDGSQSPPANARERGVYPLSGLRRKKDGQFRELPDADQKWIILSVLKRTNKQ